MEGAGVFLVNRLHATGLKQTPARRFLLREPYRSNQNPKRRSPCSFSCRSPTHLQPSVTSVPFSDGQGSTGALLLPRPASPAVSQPFFPDLFSGMFSCDWYSRSLETRSDLTSSSLRPAQPRLFSLPSDELLDSSGDLLLLQRSPLHSCIFPVSSRSWYSIRCLELLDQSLCCLSFKPRL